MVSIGNVKTTDQTFVNQCKYRKPRMIFSKVVPEELAQTDTLYEKIGGKAAVEAVAKGMYDKIYSDPRLAKWFKNTPRSRQEKIQVKFLTQTLGGPQIYDGRGMTEAHARVVSEGMGDVDYDIVVGHIATTMKELNVPQEYSSIILDSIESMRDAVLGRVQSE